MGYIVDEANRQGIYIGFPPAWGRWVEGDRDGQDKVITTQNAQAYGEFLGKRFGKKGIIWLLGGDLTATGYEEVWRALARGIAIDRPGAAQMQYVRR